MRKLEKNHISSDYRYFKMKAGSLYSMGQYEKSLSFIKAAARIAYHLNFQYADDELETLLRSISLELIKVESNATTVCEDKYVFYDYFGLDNRGLTQQYIQAFIAWDVKFLYILESESNIGSSGNILKILNGYSNCEIVIISSTFSETEKIMHAVRAINQFKPTKAFMHLAPWSVVAVCVFNAFFSMTRYLINLTDHAFWLGKSCSDYIIEFRKYGYNVSLKFRGISLNKLLIQPYYPIKECSNFRGFQTDISSKVVLFTGGAYYKMYGEKGKFFELIKRILVENENVILFIAGSGNVKPINHFIEKNNFEQRIILLGRRIDINEIFKNIDVYLATYPISGGLMALYAAENCKNIIAYSASDLPINFIEEIVRVPQSIKLTYTDEEAFHTEINKLLQNKQYRNERSEFFYNSVLSEHQFNICLKQLLNENKSNQLGNLDISTRRIFELYLEIENDFLHLYYSIIYSSIKLNIIFKPDLAIRFFVDIMVNHKLEIGKFLYKKLRSMIGR